MTSSSKPELETVGEGSIGELGPFHQTFGFYVDGVELAALVLPRGWKDRVVIVDNPPRAESVGVSTR